MENKESTKPTIQNIMPMNIIPIIAKFFLGNLRFFMPRTKPAIEHKNDNNGKEKKEKHLERIRNRIKKSEIFFYKKTSPSRCSNSP